MLKVATGKKKDNLCCKQTTENTDVNPKLFNRNSYVWNWKDPEKTQRIQPGKRVHAASHSSTILRP